MSSSQSDFFPIEQQPGLFRSHAWLEAWHHAWGDHPSHQLADLATNPSKDLSRAISLSRVLKGGILPITCASPLGTSTLSTPSIRSEYFFFPAPQISRTKKVSGYLDDTLQHDWDQFYIADILRSSPAYLSLLDDAGKLNLDVYESASDLTYAVDLREKSFSDYLQKLGKHTRLKLFNRRQMLGAIGEVTVKNIWPDRENFLYLLNKFHQARWGKDCYRGRNLSFINRLLDNLSSDEGIIDFSVLSVDDEPISVIFDICFNGRQYNIQSGYIENFNKKISLGTLHFGYQIEKSFSNPAIAFYDFMAGKGKHANYKKSLANCSDQFSSILIIRNPFLKLVYRLLYRRQRL